MRGRSRTAGIAAAVTAVLIISWPAMAQEWRPFDTPEAAPRSRPRPPQEGPAPGRAVLEPMDGASQFSRRGYGLQPYAPPSSAPADARLGEAASAEPSRPTGPGAAPIRGVIRESLDGPDGAPVGAVASSAPLAEAVGSGGDIWSGLDPTQIEQQIVQLPAPVRSPALAALMVRLLASEPPPSAAGADTATRLALLRAEALYRAGHATASRALLAKPLPGAPGPLPAALMARAEIVAGDRDAGCATARAISTAKAALPKPVKIQLIAIGGLCAVAGGNAAAAGLAAELLREEGDADSLAAHLLDALATGGKARPVLPPRVTALDFRLIELYGGTDEIQLLERAEPALIALLAGLDTGAYPHAAVAAEAAARDGLIPAARLADAYRRGRSEGPEAGDPMTARFPTPTARRAALFRTAEAERTPMRRTRLVRALVDDARRAGIGAPVLEVLAPIVTQIAPQPELGWFAETGIEVMLAAGDLDAARAWVAFGRTVDRTGGDGPEHWLALIDIADPRTPSDRGRGLASVEALAARGRLPPELLHRLATVLDALDIAVPIPLWDAANRAPQPSGGHLPATGVLAELQDAAKRRQVGRTALLAVRTIGPGGAETAHIIALGDAIRGLKRAGLAAEARRLGVEALLPGWPRLAGN